MNKKILGSAIVMAFAAAGVSSNAVAALANGSTLNFTTGLCSSSACTLASGQGSWFAMDNNNNSKIAAPERTGLAMNNGLVLGTAQAASGSHGGIPNGSESPGVDAPWAFFGNTGMHYTSSAANVLSATGNSATVDLSGWGVTWNGIAAIPMSGGAWNPLLGTTAGPYANGVARVACGVDCGNGDTFTLDYSATVPVGDPSGFGGVKYFVHLEGTVTTAPNPIPVPAAAWLFGSGLLGLAGIARRRKTA